MQPLQRSYSITEDSIQSMLQSGALKGLWDDAKVSELEELGTTISGKDQKKLEDFYNSKPIYDVILETLENAKSDKKWLSPDTFEPYLCGLLEKVVTDKKLLSKIVEGLSIMDKSAEVQKDKRGNIIYDKATKDTEIVKWSEDIEDYMSREVLPHVPDAQWFWEEDLTKKNPVIRVGAEIPFTRYFYKYQQPTPSEELEVKFTELELSVSERIAKLFGEV
jgi:type I restriction enzyme M protein